MSLKLGTKFQNLNEAGFLAKLQFINTSLAVAPATTNYPDPWPTVYGTRADLATDTTGYEAAYVAAANGDRAAIAARNALRVSLTAKLRGLARYFEEVARVANDATLLETTGYDVAQPVVRARAVHPLAAPVVTLKHGVLSGVIVGRVPRDPGAGSYEGQITMADPSVPANFQQAVIAKLASHIEFTGLNPGQLYHIRVRGIGSAGPGAWSNVASLIAL